MFNTTTVNTTVHDKLRALFREALTLFFRLEHTNIASGVSERNLCSRLAMTMDIFKGKYGFCDYYADVEYNRKQGSRAKTIINNESRVIRITSDLILHSRGEQNPDNLISIEMKIFGRRKDVAEQDRERLMAMTMPLDDILSTGGKDPEHVAGYLLGYFLELNHKCRSYKLEEYTDGQLASKHEKQYF